MTESKHNNSPVILSVKWGMIEVEGLGAGKDFMLWPGGGRNWDWCETGTKHSPGIQQADCQELVKRGCRNVVLSRGMFLRLKVSGAALDYLKKNNIEIFTSETKKAVKEYNQLVKMGKKVGGLFHSTC